MKYRPELAGCLPNLFFFADTLGYIQLVRTESDDGASFIAQQYILHLNRDNFAVSTDEGLLTRSQRLLTTKLAVNFVASSGPVAFRDKVRVMLPHNAGSRLPAQIAQFLVDQANHSIYVYLLAGEWNLFK